MATTKAVASGAMENSGAAILRMVKQKRGVAGARERIVDAMPEMADALVEEAKKGSVPHLKLAFELGGVDKRAAKAAVAKPVYAQRVERQLLRELDEMPLPEEASDVG